jgi:hypothetical protein
LSRFTIALLVAAFALISLPVCAEPISAALLLDAKVDYSADFALTSGNGTYRGVVVHAPGRERREFQTATGRQVLLLRRDIDQATMMWPERKWYVSTSFTAVAGLVGGFEELTLDRRVAGRETVAGEATTRYDVTGTSDRGGSVNGRMWLTKDGILMKASGHVTFDGRDTPFDMALMNLRRIKSDPTAFVLPADYKGVPLDLSKMGMH